MWTEDFGPLYVVGVSRKGGHFDAAMPRALLFRPDEFLILCLPKSLQLANVTTIKHCEMQTLDPDVEEPRLANALRSSGRPADNQGVSAAAREGELQRVEGMKIAQSAVQGIGMSTNDFRRIRTAKPNHALAVSILFTRATNQTIIPGTPPGHVLSTSLLYNSLLHDSRFMQVRIGRAAPGDIVLQSGTSPDGYAGIVVDHGRIISDSSNGVRNDSSLVEAERLLPSIHLFRYIGVQKYPGYTAAILANAGYNANEPRLPAGQPGGGQWTNGSLQKAGAEKNYNGARIGHAAKQTAKAFLSSLASSLRGMLFPSEPDRESSKPRTLLELAKEVDEAADNIDMTKPKGLGHAMAAGVAIAAGDAISEGAASVTSKVEPSGLDAISEAKERVQSSKDTYGGVDAQNMGKRQSDKTEGSEPHEENTAKLQPYSEGIGHHVPAKSAFTGDPAYDLDTALAIPNSYLLSQNISHSTITGAQQSLYRTYARSGQPLTWDAVRSIETEALVKGGMKLPKAAATVGKAIDALKASGVSKPTRIPWGGN